MERECNGKGVQVLKYEGFNKNIFILLFPTSPCILQNGEKFCNNEALEEEVCRRSNKIDPKIKN